MEPVDFTMGGNGIFCLAYLKFLKKILNFFYPFFGEVHLNRCRTKKQDDEYGESNHRTKTEMRF